LMPHYMLSLRTLEGVFKQMGVGLLLSVCLCSAHPVALKSPMKM
jgi:hypothetical protein